MRDRQIVDLDIWGEYEGPDGRRVTFWRDLDRLEAHLCELAPADVDLIRRLTKDARRLAAADPMAEAPPRELMGFLDMLRLGPKMLPWVRPTIRWGKVSMADLADRFHSELVRDAVRALLPPQFGAMILLNTLGWLHAGDAGYPLGGSLPLARNVERRYTELGGEIRYKARVSRILTERTGGVDRATGVELADGTQEGAEIVISAADGHATIYEMLGSRYIDETLRDYYERERLPLFFPILYVGVGVDQEFADEAPRISGPHFMADEPIGAGAVHKRVLEARIGDAVVRALNGRFPGLKDKVEMVDVATPATTVRYTANWRASFEGWMPTRGYLTKGPPKRLPGLDDFYMVGQWVQPGGGLPSGVMTAREVLQLICARDGVKFQTTMT